ncbi:MAG: cupin domain-containing protein [Oscillochloris sp.]|nr:cupin domain-containing protein [Oscillochloris sp.]
MSDSELATRYNYDSFVPEQFAPWMRFDTSPPHYHDRDETLVLISGRLRATVDNEVAELNPGDALLIPAGAIHQLANAGDQPAEWLIMSALPVRFFRPDGEELFPGWAR